VGSEHKNKVFPNHRESEQDRIMNQQPQWKRDGAKKKGRKTPQNARRKRKQINHWRSVLKKQ
jgi:hypothetical protein